MRESDSLVNAMWTLSLFPYVSWRARSVFLVQMPPVPVCPAAAGVSGPSERLCPCEETQRSSLKKQSHAKLFTTEVRILLIQVIFEINTARSVRFSIGKSCLKNVTSTIMEIKMLLGFAIMPQSCTFFLLVLKYTIGVSLMIVRMG